MFGFNSWTDFTAKAAESLQQASESAKTGLQSVSNKTKEFASSFPDNAKEKLNNIQTNVTTFVQDQRLQYKQVEHETELKKRRKERRSKLLKHGIPPWHVFEEDIDGINLNENSEKESINNDNDNNNDDNSNDDSKESDLKSKKNCTFEELRLLILKLCEDENTFLIEAPSSLSVFSFNMDTALPYANAALNYDPILPRIRYKLVPKRLSETQFWKNYFYRVQLIRESMGYPKLDLSVNAPTMDQIRQKVINNLSSTNKISTNTNDTNDNNNNNNNSNQVGTKNDEKESKSIFEQSNYNYNNSNNHENISTKPTATSPHSPRDTNEINPESDRSEIGTDNDLDTNNNNNNNLLSSVVSLDGSEISVTSNDNSIVKINKSDTNDNVNNNDNDNNDNDEDDDDYMASNDLHIDALTPEARARMTKELGLKKNNINGNSNGNNHNNISNNSINNENESILTDKNITDEINGLSGDTEDVDELLANVDVDGASDISDDELAKVMSEVENS